MGFLPSHQKHAWRLGQSNTPGFQVHCWPGRRRYERASRRVGVPANDSHYLKPQLVLSLSKIKSSLFHAASPPSLRSDKGTTPEFNFQACIPDFPNLTPLAPLSACGEGGRLVPRAAHSPSPFTERGLGGEVEKARKNETATPKVEAERCTLVSSLRFPPLREGNRKLARFPLRSRGNLKEGVYSVLPYDLGTI